MKQDKVFTPRPIDRAVIFVLAVLLVATAIYVIGPWYLDETDPTKAPLTYIFKDDQLVVFFGILTLINGLLLLYASTLKAASVRNTKFLGYTLLAGFLLRLYSIIGVMITIESWRPPAFLSHFATVSIFAVYWLWVKSDARPIE